MSSPATLDPPIESYQGFVVTIASQYRNRAVPMEDLVHEGMLGLAEAARRYDPGRQTKFITYAMWWVRKFVLRGLEQQSQLVRVPDYQRRKQQGAGSLRILSLDSPFGDRLADGRIVDPEAELLRNESRMLVRNSVARLTVQEKTVLHHRYGLSGGPHLTLDETGRTLGLSGERVRQIERAALRRMRFDLARSGGRGKKKGGTARRPPTMVSSIVPSGT